MVSDEGWGRKKERKFCQKLEQNNLEKYQHCGNCISHVKFTPRKQARWSLQVYSSWNILFYCITNHHLDSLQDIKPYLPGAWQCSFNSWRQSSPHLTLLSVIWHRLRKAVTSEKHLFEKPEKNVWRTWDHPNRTIGLDTLRSKILSYQGALSLTASPQRWSMSCN